MTRPGTPFLWSIVVRQAIASTLFMLIVIALLGLAARTVVERQQRAALLATIDTDIAGLADGMAAGGIGQVSARIADRLALTTADDARYRLTDPAGRRVAGDLADDGALDPTRSAAGTIATDAGLALARATRLRGGYTLVVARSLRPVAAVVDRLTALFALAAIPAAVASLLAGAWLARRFSRRVARLNDVFGRFEAGDRSARAGAGQGRQRDEIDRLAGHVDTHLAHTDRLIAAQRQISDNIAHELRTPLGHLDARLIAMLERVADATLEDELHRARDDIRTIVTLFDALLDLALAEATSGEAAMTCFDLSEQIADLAELYGASAEEAGLGFTARITPAVTMHGEPMAMTRAVANLLDNAFKYTAAGAHIRLTIAPGPCIVVEDDGPGVAPALQPHLFERFRRVREQGGHGHGLGLALVKVIALRHGLIARFEDVSPGARFILEPEASS